jgi:hypothetical protein
MNNFSKKYRDKYLYITKYIQTVNKVSTKLNAPYGVPFTRAPTVHLLKSSSSPEVISFFLWSGATNSIIPKTDYVEVLSLKSEIINTSKSNLKQELIKEDVDFMPYSNFIETFKTILQPIDPELSELPLLISTNTTEAKNILSGLVMRNNDKYLNWKPYSLTEFKKELR